MNHAICLKCGTGKAGALAQCPRCGFRPQATEDKAKSILLSDRCARMPVLQKFGERIARGEKMKFDDADVLRWIDTLDAAPKPVVKVMGLTRRQWTIFGAALAGGIAFAFFLGAMKDLMQ
jgi:hypothetical protein